MRLSDHIDAWRERPHSWDGATCAHFVTGWLAAHGRRLDIGRWMTKPGALRWFRRHIPIDDWVSRHLEPIPPALAQRGDVARLAPDVCVGVDVFGLVDSAGVWVFSEEGLTILPRRHIVAAWRGARAEEW